MKDKDLVISREVVSTLRKINAHLCFYPEGEIKLKIGNVALKINTDYLINGRLELNTLLQAVKDSFNCEKSYSLFNILRRVLNGQAAKSKSSE